MSNAADLDSWLECDSDMTRLSLLGLVAAMCSLSAVPSTPAIAGDGVTDNTAALRALVHEWNIIQIPAGTFNLSEMIDLPDHPVTIRGAGIDQTILRWTAPVIAGIRGRFSLATGRTVILEDLTLATAIPNGTALDLDWPDQAWIGVWPTVRVANVAIHGELRPATGWLVGIRLEDAWNAELTNVTILGGYPQSFNGFVMHAGVILSKQTIAARIQGLRISWAHIGLEALGAVEGLAISQSTMVGTRYGIYAHADRQVPHLAVTDTHIAASQVWLLLINRVQTTLTSNLLYQWSGPHEGPYYGVILGPGSDFTRAIGNYIMSRPNNPGAHGIVVQNGTTHTVVQGNIGALLYSTLWVQPGAQHVASSGNLAHQGIVELR